MLFLRSENAKAEFQKAETTRRYVTAVLKSHAIELVVMEACGPSGWINDLCTERKIETFVCRTNDEACQWSKVKRKTDKDYALKLARMACMKGLSELWKGQLDL